WTLWQVVQERPRASWRLPCQKNCWPLVWQVRQTWDCAAGARRSMRGRRALSSGVAPWAAPRPWPGSPPVLASPAEAGLAVRGLGEVLRGLVVTGRADLAPHVRRGRSGGRRRRGLRQGAGAVRQGERGDGPQEKDGEAARLHRCPPLELVVSQRDLRCG